MMKFEFDTDEVSVLLLSLISRRISVKGLLEVVDRPKSIEMYTSELVTVESMMNKVVPGCVEAIKKSEMTS